jgi:oligopeptide transport system substrate-binding protein
MRIKHGVRSLLFLTLVIAGVVTGCEKKKDQVESQQILRLNLPDDPLSLDPRSVRLLRDLTVVLQVFEGLMRLDHEGIPQPALAEKVEISEDQLSYTFHLREAYWSNQDLVTAYDFAYTWTKVLDPSFASDYTYLLYPIKNAQLAHEGKCPPEEIGVTALDEKRLVVQLESPTPYFLELLAFPIYYPVNHKIDAMQKNWALPPGEQFVCNGPFQLKHWAPQRELLLEKNPLYWDSLAVHLDKIHFSVIADNSTENHLFEKNELDWLGQPLSSSVVTESLEQLKEQGVLCSYPVLGTCWFKFNTQVEPFNNAKLRKAFAYAIDRKEIITHILQGNQSVATGLLPPLLALNDTPHFQDGNVEEAKKLLEEALEETGWTLQRLPKIVLHYPPSERNVKIVQLVQQQWKRALGIQVELAAMEAQLYFRKLRQGPYQIGIGDWFADFNDPLAFLELFKYNTDSGCGMNDTGWQNETFISLLNQSLTEKNPEKRKALLKGAEALLIEEMPIIPLYHTAFDYVKKSYIKNTLLSPHGLADFKRTTIAR